MRPKQRSAKRNQRAGCSRAGTAAASALDRHETALDDGSVELLLLRARRPHRRHALPSLPRHAAAPGQASACSSAATTWSLCAWSISGNMGSDRMRSASRSATGKSPRA